MRYGFNPHDFERFFESPHHRQTPKAPRDSLESGHYDVAMIQSRQKDLENL
ncbi:hypothetical protein HpMS113_04930 [Helicobacter pylori]